MANETRKTEAVKSGQKLFVLRLHDGSDITLWAYGADDARGIVELEYGYRVTSVEVSS